MSAAEPRLVHVHPRIADIDAAQWDACANPDPATFNPFLSHAFLDALELSGAVGETTGWLPQHLSIAGADGTLAGVMPLYVKLHSQGEYVFDHAWADAFQRAGGRYFPKLIGAVPFTPVPGRRLLVRPAPDAEETATLLAASAIRVAERIGASSVHVNFLRAEEWRRLAALNFLQRTDQQFHWSNHDYRSFDDFLAGLASRKCKAIRRERAEVAGAGITLERLTGAELTEAHWDTFFAFYMDTGNRKWGRPYLNRRFFSLLGSTLADRCLLVMAKRQGRPIAGALNLIGGDCLYGRYWGSTEHHPCLHFEVCYYQAIDFAISRGLARVEAGAQGEHKLARGYLPTPTYSAHWIADAGLRRAIARYLDAERAAVDETIAELAEAGPYRRGDAT
ncbi:MAG: GNAT family N-acetyltransferase [Hyphomicrobium sp.]